METRGGVLIQGLWIIQTDTIINVRFGYSYSDTYKKELIGNLLAQWDEEKINEHVKHYHEQRKYFSSFVFLVYFMLRRKALVVVLGIYCEFIPN